ncbi:TPA: hypothetical protein EYQ19_02655 [Candidatus Pacearchaeota archaeon]|nr:hypothetical protein [Candidatus Pacearchaeota archaeon]
MEKDIDKIQKNPETNSIPAVCVKSVHCSTICNFGNFNKIIHILKMVIEIYQYGLMVEHYIKLQI